MYAGSLAAEGLPRLSRRSYSWNKLVRNLVEQLNTLFYAHGENDKFFKYYILQYFQIQAALVIRGGYVPQKYREYQNRDYQ